MKNKQNYIQDIAEIRSMMERSSKFLSLSGWAGILAGVLALTGTFIVYRKYQFYPDEIFYQTEHLSWIVITALLVFFLSLILAVYFSWNKAKIKGENIWNPTSKRLLFNMLIPLGTSGVFILILISKGLIGLIIPTTLLFYGLSLAIAGIYTIGEVRLMGFIQIIIGLLSFWYIEYSLLFWGLGFGVVHILYGIYMYVRFER